MKTILSISTQISTAKQNLVSKAQAFLKDETSAKGSSEEGYLVYAGIVIGIIVLGIASAFMTDSFTDIGRFFDDGVNGNNTNPNGWGN